MRLLLSLLRIVVLLPSYTLALLIRLLKWLIAPPLLALQMLLGVPLALWRARQSLEPRFLPLTDADLPDPAWVALTDATESLAADGFIPCSDFRCDELIQGATFWLRLLVQPEHGVSAMAALVEFQMVRRPSRAFIEFSATFEDQRVLDINNFPFPYGLPAPAWLARLQLKDVWDPRALYLLHRELMTSLLQEGRRVAVRPTAGDPVRMLKDNYAREMRALMEQGWLRAEGKDQARLTLRGAWLGVWRQAWPLASVYLRVADRRSRRLLAEHDVDVDDFTGSAPSVLVDCRPLPADAGSISTVWGGYEYVRPLAQQTDPEAVLEAVVVELAHDEDGSAGIGEFRYAFRSSRCCPERRIHRLASFEIFLDPADGDLTVTAMDREFEQAADEAEWRAITTALPLPALRPGPWLRDLDTVLPIALQALNTRSDAGWIEPDSASLYIDEGGVPRWQVVVWTEEDTPLHVELDARI